MFSFESVKETTIEISEIKKGSIVDSISIEKLDMKINFEKNSMLPKTNGTWTGEEGNSKWVPDPEYVPQEKSRNPEKPYSNPDNITLQDILRKYGLDGIDFIDGEPDFSKLSKGDVEISDFSDDRNENFYQADEKLAEQKGCSPEDVEKWRKENNYTWHECADCKTMQKVPNEVHANIPHSGGISVIKKINE